MEALSHPAGSLQDDHVMDQGDEGVTERMRVQALVIAMTIRNAMEDFHGSSRGPTDEQMAVLNPIIRNGALTALHALGADNGRRRDWAGLQAERQHAGRFCDRRRP